MGHKQSHELQARDEHYTPKFIFDELGLVFDLDVAAPSGGGGLDSCNNLL